MGSQSTAADCSAACHAAADFRCKFFSFGRGSCRASVTPGSSTDLTTASETAAGCPCLAESTASDSAEWAGGCVEGFTETADYDFYEVTAPPAKPPTCDRRIPPDGPEAWGRLALSASCVGAALHGSKACSRADRALVLGYAFVGWLILLALLGMARCLLAVNRARRRPSPSADLRPKLLTTTEVKAELEAESKAKDAALRPKPAAGFQTPLWKTEAELEADAEAKAAAMAELRPEFKHGLSSSAPEPTRPADRALVGPTLSALGAYGSDDAIARTLSSSDRTRSSLASFHSLRKQVTHEMHRLGSSALLVRDQSVRLTYALDLDDMQYANMEDEIQEEIETAETQAELDKVLDVAFQITSLARQGSGEMIRSMTSLRRPSSQASLEGQSLSQRSRSSLVSRVLSPRGPKPPPKCSVGGDYQAGGAVAMGGLEDLATLEEATEVGFTE